MRWFSVRRAQSCASVWSSAARGPVALVGLHRAAFGRVRVGGRAPAEKRPPARVPAGRCVWEHGLWQGGGPPPAVPRCAWPAVRRGKCAQRLRRWGNGEEGAALRCGQGVGVGGAVRRCVRVQQCIGSARARASSSVGLGLCVFRPRGGSLALLLQLSFPRGLRWSSGLSMRLLQSNQSWAPSSRPPFAQHPVVCSNLSHNLGSARAAAVRGSLT